MEGAAVDWLSLLAVFAASLLVGALCVWRAYASARNRVDKPEASLLPRRDLLGKRDELVQQLRELMDTAVKRTPEQLARERYALELEAAQVLRELDTPSALVPARQKDAAGRAASPSSSAPLRAGNPVLRGLLWGLTSMAAVGLLLFLVIKAVQPREPGGSVTGETSMGRAGSSEGTGPGSADAQEAQLKAAVMRNPEDVEARLELARVYLVKQDLRGAWTETEEVLRRSPGDARALTYQGLIRSAAGQPDVALGLFQQAIAKKPDLLEAYLQLAFAYVRLDRVPDAEATIAVASSRFPAKAAMMTRLLARMREQVAQEQRAGASAPVRAGATSRRVAGVVDLDPALRGKLAAGSIVWVTVREAGVEKGPPIAVKRLAASAFPIAFSVGEADAMAGQPFPEKVRIEARVASDGDPSTRDPSNPSARLDGVPAGATNLRLVMAR